MTFILFASMAFATNSPSLVTASDLEGGAMVEAPRVVRTRRVNTAMLSSLEAEAQIRRVELFLKSGPAQSGDLRVVQSGKPDPQQK